MKLLNDSGEDSEISEKDKTQKNLQLLQKQSL